MDTPGSPLSFLERQTPCPQCGSQDAWVLPGPQGKTATAYCAQCRTKLTTLTRPTLKERAMAETKEKVAPPSAPMMTVASKPEPDDIPEPTVPPAVIEAATAPLVSTLPEHFGAHEALLQGFCQHLQQKIHAFMMDEHTGFMEMLAAPLAATRQWIDAVGQQNEHATYTLGDALTKLQTEGLTLIAPPYQAILHAQTPTGYTVTLTLTKSTSGALVEELGRLEGWLQANGYQATEVRV